ncbi:hypothetical protein [Chryseobacterium sp.]|uniref:hypothetical protein n=1 Tax=Chryseobacterium sp. TaxID=1871047 RepID=UPI0028A15244|nr:hypothetical protein [Chryseobacterium sp.]
METNNIENEVLDILQKVKEVIYECDRLSQKLINETKSKLDVLELELHQYPSDKLQYLARNSDRVRNLFQEIETLQNKL